MAPDEERMLKELVDERLEHLIVQFGIRWTKRFTRRPPRGRLIA